MVYVIAYVAPTTGKSARTVTFAVDPSTFSTRTSFTSQRGPASRHSSMFKLLSVAACVRNTFHAPRSLLVVGPAVAQALLPAVSRLVSTRFACVARCRIKSVPMSGDAAGRSACATSYPTDACEKRRLDVRDHVDLNQRIARNSTGGGNRGAHRRFRAEAALEHFIHGCPVLNIVEIDVGLQDLFHGRSHALQLLLDGIQHDFGMGLDVARDVRSYTGDEEQIAVGDRAVEERRLGRWRRLLAILVKDPLGGLLGLRRGGGPHSRRGGHATSQEIPSIGLFHVISFRLPAACAARPILVLLRRPPRLAILTQCDRARHLAALGGSGELA